MQPTIHGIALRHSADGAYQGKQCKGRTDIACVFRKEKGSEHHMVDVLIS
jgi:hypothetical protein